MTNSCSINLLESAVDGSLQADDEVALQHHLEECESCSAALERMAGWTEWCKEASTLLTEDELDELQPSREDWAVDFTVEHLEPSDKPDAIGRLGDFDVLEIIGQGGMGVVLKAHRPGAQSLRGDQGVVAASGTKFSGEEAICPRSAGGRGGRASACAGDSSGAAERDVAVSW